MTLANSTPQVQLIDDAGTGLTYIGSSETSLENPATTSEPTWSIQRLFQNGNITKKDWAEGTATHDKIWDDRTLYTYV